MIIIISQHSSVVGDSCLPCWINAEPDALQCRARFAAGLSRSDRGKLTNGQTAEPTARAVEE
jgi:hypothetical protein